MSVYDYSVEKVNGTKVDLASFIRKGAFDCEYCNKVRFCAAVYWT